jgi:hypothetical protein
MKTFSCLAAQFHGLVPIAIAICLPATMLLGQSKESPKDPPNTTLKEPRTLPKEELESMRVGLEFRDATLQEAVDYLASKFEGMNIVVPASVAQLRVTIKLRNVTLDQALEAIAFATQNQVTVNRLNENIYGFAPTNQAPAGPGVPLEKPACRIFALADAPQFAGSPDSDNATKLIAEVKASIDQAIELLRSADPQSSVERPSLEFHPATKLLIAVGRSEELGIVEQLVSALGGTKAVIPAPTGSGAPGPEAARQRKPGR